MKVYASSWDPKLLAIDTRRIYAVCSNELYGGHYQKKWVLGFYNECMAKGINIKEGGNYQARLDVFRDTKDDLMDGCEYAFGSFEHEQLEGLQESWRPNEEGPDELGFEQRMCSGPGQPKTYPGSDLTMPSLGFCFETKNLQACSRCKAVLCKSIASKVCHTVAKFIPNIPSFVIRLSRSLYWHIY